MPVKPKRCSSPAPCYDDRLTSPSGGDATLATSDHIGRVDGGIRMGSNTTYTIGSLDPDRNYRSVRTRSKSPGISGGRIGNSAPKGSAPSDDELTAQGGHTTHAGGDLAEDSDSTSTSSPSAAMPRNSTRLWLSSRFASEQLSGIPLAETSMTSADQLTLAAMPDDARAEFDARRTLHRAMHLIACADLAKDMGTYHTNPRNPGEQAERYAQLENLFQFATALADRIGRIDVASTRRSMMRRMGNEIDMLQCRAFVPHSLWPCPARVNDYHMALKRIADMLPATPVSGAI